MIATIAIHGQIINWVRRGDKEYETNKSLKLNCQRFIMFPTIKLKKPIICINNKPIKADMVNPINFFFLILWERFPVINTAGINPARYPKSGVSRYPMLPPPWNIGR